MPQPDVHPPPAGSPATGPPPAATVLCLTPVRNEAWILDRFLRCAATWADRIVVADQGSDDGSAEIAARHPRVHLVPNDGAAYDEAARQRLLLDAARALPAAGRRVLLALDADEVLSANWRTSPEWQTLLAAPPGTVVYLRWANLRPDLGTCWIPPEPIPFGFVDDGSAHGGAAIHSRRLPTPAGAPALVLHDLVVLHYQYTDWERMRSKQRWYQAWEALHQPRSSNVDRFRLYHQMEAVPEQLLQPVRPEWFAGYASGGIDLTSVRREGRYRWDREVRAWMDQHGTRPFRRVNIWDVDWSAIAPESAGGDGQAGERPPLADPRTPVDRAVMAWLRATQGRRSLAARAGDFLLRRLGW
jgi:hypothetical protein